MRPRHAFCFFLVVDQLFPPPGIMSHSTRSYEKKKRICCEETDQARQARIEELFMHQVPNPTSVSQLLTQIHDLQNKVNSVRHKRFFTILDQETALERPTSKSTFYYCESQNHASLRFGIAARYTEYKLLKKDDPLQSSTIQRIWASVTYTPGERIACTRTRFSRIRSGTSCGSGKN